MAIETTFTCDVCGVKKGTTNHWWSLFKQQDEDGPHVAIYSGTLIIDGSGEGILYACGEQHAHQLAGNLMKRLPTE